MSQLRKSASFRSRIPVRRTRIPQRRCSSPPPGSAASSGVSYPHHHHHHQQHQQQQQQQQHQQWQQNRSQQQYQHQERATSGHRNVTSSHQRSPLKYEGCSRRYSSSSFSSSDESCESEEPFQHLMKKVTDVDQSLYISTDVISLDGLLDSVSSGSFSSPPSPVQYQNTNRTKGYSSSYESLDKYNRALETLKLTNDYVNQQQLPGIMLFNESERFGNKYRTNHEKEHQKNTDTDLDTSYIIEDDSSVNDTSEAMLEGCGSSTGPMELPQYNINDTIDTGMESFSLLEKQKQLSDWYYIKTDLTKSKQTPSTSRGTYSQHERIIQTSMPSYKQNFTEKLNYDHYPDAESSSNNNPSIKRDDDFKLENSLNNTETRAERFMNDSPTSHLSGFSTLVTSDPNGYDTVFTDDYNNLQDTHMDTVRSKTSVVLNLQENIADKIPSHTNFQQHLHTPAISPVAKPSGSRKTHSNKNSGRKVKKDALHGVASYDNEGCRDDDEQLSTTAFHNWRDGRPQFKFRQSYRIGYSDPKHNRHRDMLSARMRFIQKRSDETSTSSFEHLNMTPFPTNHDIDICESEKKDTPETHIWNWTGGFDSFERKYLQAKRRPLPQPPVELGVYPPKSTSFRSDCELSGSYVSLECPSPPGPPTCLPESRRDPQVRLGNYLKTLYMDLALKEPIIPPWAVQVTPGALCAARLEPEMRLHAQSHGFSDCITVDQILTSIHTKEGSFVEAPKRVLIECPPWISRSALCLRILHAWAKEPPWPQKGTPVALTLFIPLAELKRSFSNYVEKELLPKGPLNPFCNGFGGFSAAWNSLESLGPKLLVILDGYEYQRGSPKRKGKQYPPDVHDLLDGKLFPDARVIIVTSSPNNTELLPLVQRHIKYEGLTWGRSVSLLCNGQWGTPSRLLDTVQGCANLRRIVRTPLGCLAVAAIYEATAGELPTEELDVIESVLNCVAPEMTQTNIAELGRLTLFCLKMKRPSITGSEIRMYCSIPESNIMGCLDKGLVLGKTARKKSEPSYHIMCPGMAEFLAANYISSLANRPGLLAAEITGLSLGDELEPELYKVITYAMGLLGARGHVLLSKLTPLWLTPQAIFSLALAGGSTDGNMSALCDILGISKHPPISPLETKPIWVQVRSIPNELMGWGMAVRSSTCTLKNLEIIYQMEKHNLLESRSSMDVFLDSLTQNESVSTLRFSSLIETDVKESEINYLASCISKIVCKPRLENFELILTLLEEDPPILKLQSVVTTLCRTIPKQPKLSSLLLDLGLSTSQLVQICTTLDKCPHVTRLSLPHLRCERGAIGALAALLTMRPLTFLALPSCWGARDDPPSSSGVSMGSGSGSSTGTSGLIKQSSLTGVPSPRSYPPGLFSSLPRGVFIPTTNMGRSATLPRQPMEPPADKRSSDSVVSKTWYPTPGCDGGPHSSGTLHELLLAAREPYSKLHGLDLSKAQLSLEDSMCLGETVRLSNTLHSLKLEGSSRLSEILPSILGASESPCLQMLSIGSPRLSLEDSAIAMSARALTSCSTLRLLSVDGWSFRIENPSSLSILRAFLSLTSIRELSLSNCRLHIGILRSDTKIYHAFECRSVVVLKLAGAQMALADSTILRGPQLLPYIGGFPCLRELDLSAQARSGLGGSTSSPFILDDKCLMSFFQSLHSHFSLLNTLKMCNWVIHLDDISKTFKNLSKCIKNSPLSHLKLDGISVLDRPKKVRIEPLFLHCLISTLPMLRWMGISLASKKEDQILAIGNAVLDLKGYEIDIKLSESTIEQAKSMSQAIGVDGKFDIKVSTFGTSSGILIHAEKSGTKSLSRKHKD